jgi:hypothetical protein
MIPFGLAHELKKAGFTQSAANNARYFVNEHLMINREDAVHMWHADKEKKDWELKVEEELVYCPTLSELIEGCSLPFVLSSETTGRWHAKDVVLDEPAIGEGATPVEAVARLWLIRRANL